jgi:two-component system cell cycle sensor histidine kinase/response regulator CckA
LKLHDLHAPDLRRYRGRLVAALLDDPGAWVALLDRAGGILRAGGSWSPLPATGEAAAALPEPACSLLRQAVAEGRALDLNTRINATPAALRLTPARAGRVAAILRLTDASRVLELEEALGQAQRLQEVGELAGGIAHDFNNLLTAILGAAEDLDRRATDGEGPAAAENRADLAQIQASATRGAELVRQLLAFSQRQTLQPRVLALDETVADAASLLRRLLGSKVRLVLALRAAGRQVHMDATQLGQVLVNLAVNARNAMPDGGTITIATDWRLVLRPEELGTATIPPGRYATVTVSDTGSGIAPDILARIFDPFFTTRRGEGGTGLGLSMVQGIVRQSGGYLSVVSTPGHGTCFTITLPRHEAAQPAPHPEAARPVPHPEAARPVPHTEAARPAPHPKAAPPCDPAAVPQAAPAGGRRVLLVDDDDAIRRLARRALIRAGCEVTDADGAEQALLTDPAALDCVVSDVAMPGLDGPGLVRNLRQRRPDLPAILISGYADAEQRRALAAEDIAFLPKPFSMADLTGAVRKALERAPA